jgi:hypothetical protein
MTLVIVLFQSCLAGACAGALLWYVRRQVRELNRRISRVIELLPTGSNLIASAHASSLLTERFPQAYMPVSDFTMNPVNLQALVARVEASHPHLIVEIGSGLSTVLLGGVVGGWGGRVVSFDQDPQWLALCQRHIAAAGVGDHVSLHGLYGSVDAVAIARQAAGPGQGIDFLVVDGPYDPDHVGAREREAMRFKELLAPHATVYLDDTNRPMERRLIERLRSLFPQASVEVRESSTGFALIDLGATGTDVAKRLRIGEAP